MKPTTKTIIAILVILVVVISIPVAVYLVRQRQDIREKAAVPTGQATVAVSPGSGSYEVGQSFPVSVSFDTAGIAMSAVAIRITYPYSSDTPELMASDIQTSPAIASSELWTCPVKNVTFESQIVQVDIACVFTGIDGFTSSGDTQLASFTMLAESVPAINPTILTFDPQQSIITQKTDGKDVLLIPTSTGSYTITAGTDDMPSPTPSPTGVDELTPGPTDADSPQPTDSTTTPTPSPTDVDDPGTGGGAVTPTSTLAPTSTTTPATSTNTPTETFVGNGDELPDSGVSTPTLMIIFGGLLMVITSATFFASFALRKRK